MPAAEQLPDQQHVRVRILKMLMPSSLMGWHEVAILEQFRTLTPQ